MNEAQQRLLRERLLNLSRRIAMVAGNNNPDTHLSWSDEILAIVKDVDLAVLEQPQGEPVAWLWEYIGGDRYAQEQNAGGVARTIKEMDPHNPPWPSTWKPLRPLFTHASPTPPPDEGLIKRVDECINGEHSFTNYYQTASGTKWYCDQCGQTQDEGHANDCIYRLIRDLRDAYVKSMGRVK